MSYLHQQISIQGNWQIHQIVHCVGKIGTLEHILSSCNVVLGQGRYTWRHNQVLRQLADTIELAKREKQKGPRQKQQQILFVREGEKISVNRVKPTGILDQAEDWKLSVDLDTKLVFPEIVTTNLRPDMVLWSPSKKNIVIIELTIPWEERTSEAHERKKAKYTELVEEYRAQGWRALNYPVEVGCKGFPAQSVWRCFTALGIRGKQRKAAVGKLCKEAERASCWLWMRREDSWRPTFSTQ